MAVTENVVRGAGDGARTQENGKGAQLASDLQSLLDKVKAAHRKNGAPDYDKRIEHLDKLERAVLARKHDFAKAISMDFGSRSKHETLGAEVMVVLQEIKHARAHLHEWMETEPRDVSWMFLPGRAEVMMQPVGVVGIVSPWNYPMQLALGPLVGALAAGCSAIIKPSELVPDTAELLKTMITETFAPDHVSVVTGGVDVAEAFSRLPFDHLLFTGSTRLGKIVMKAAAENLVPVTLELGGKSPAIVGDGYSLTKAAEKIMYGKLLNAGQTCIAPDYVMVPKGKVDAFVEECRIAVGKMYETLQNNPDYTAIINDRQYERLQSYLTDARNKGAKLVEINPAKEQLDANARKMAPVLLVHPKEDMIVMQEEIFGPILPVRAYESIDEAIDYVNDHARPLALYVFDSDNKRIEKVVDRTISGGVCVNETLLHVAQSDLPFGGVGGSGMGHYHGREGFEAFTKKKPIFYQSRINGMSLFRPPYKERMDFALKTFLGK